MLMKWIIALSAVALFGQLTAARAAETPAAIAAKRVGAGWVFTDPKGMSLYIYERDKPGQSTCIGPCATTWPPVVATADTGIAGSADWSLVERNDGTKQLAHRGMPLYRYAKDPAPGTTFGDGVADAWRIARQDMATPPGIVIGRGIDGRFLTDAQGRMLYVNDEDKLETSGKSLATFKSACAKSCLEGWKPLIAPLAALATGGWSIAVRDDGLRQWVYQHRPLYLRAGSAKSPDGAPDRVWHAAVVEPPPPLPAWATYQPTDGGELVADASGFTVYAYIENAKGGQYGSPLNACDADCIRAFWRPIVAAPDAKPVGNWTIQKGFDGLSQWAYRGELLFTHTRDTEPGEIAGTRFFTRAWHTLTRSGRIMEGMER